MFLYEIIAANDSGTKQILIEKLLPYKKLLFKYYSSQFKSKPVLVVTSVCNAVQYAFIAPVENLDEAIETYLDDSYITEPEDRSNEKETILFNSVMLSDL